MSYVLSPMVRAAFNLDGRTAVLQLQTRRWTYLDPAAGCLLYHLMQGQTLQQTYIVTATEFDVVVERLQRDVQPVISKLCAEKILQPAQEEIGRVLPVFVSDSTNTPTANVSMVNQALMGRSLPVHYRLVSYLGLVVAVTLLYGIKLRFDYLERMMHFTRRFAKQPTAQQAERLREAVRWAARYYPGRAACLEVSLATCIAGALVGKQPTWCIGVSFDPEVLKHAWVEVAGVPIGEDEVENWPFRTAIQV